MKNILINMLLLFFVLLFPGCYTQFELNLPQTAKEIATKSDSLNNEDSYTSKKENKYNEDDEYCVWERDILGYWRKVCYPSYSEYVWQKYYGYYNPYNPFNPNGLYNWHSWPDIYIHHFIHVDTLGKNNDTTNIIKKIKRPEPHTSLKKNDNRDNDLIVDNSAASILLDNTQLKNKQQNNIIGTQPIINKKVETENGSVQTDESDNDMIKKENEKKEKKKWIKRGSLRE